MVSDLEWYFNNISIQSFDTVFRRKGGPKKILNFGGQSIVFHGFFGLELYLNIFKSQMQGFELTKKTNFGSISLDCLLNWFR